MLPKSEQMKNGARFMGGQIPGRPNFGPVFAPDDAPPATPPANDPPATPPATPPADPPATPPAGDPLAAPPATGAEWRKLVTDPDALKEAERTTDLNAAFRRISELRGNLSKAIIRPSEKASPEEVAAYRKAMDIPEDAKGYEVARPEHIPEEQWNSEGVQSAINIFTSRLHAKNASKEVVKEATDAYFALEAEAVKAQIANDKKVAADAEAALRREWPGEEFNTNKEYGVRGITKFAEAAGISVDELRKIETKAGTFLMDDPRMIKLFAAAGREMGESSGGAVLTAAERGNLDGEIREYNAKIDAALAQNNHTEANRLDQELQAKIAKRDGNKAIVGAGRAA